MRRVLSTGVAALVLMLVGCGGGSSSPHAVPSVPAATTTPLTPAKARALAAAAILTPGDLPGYTSKAQSHDASDDASDRQLQACVGVPAPTYLARNFGTSFSKGHLEIDSSADVVSSPAEARSELQALSGSKAPECVKRSLSALLGNSGGTISSFAVTPVKLSVPGSDGAFGYRLDLKATIQGHQLRFGGYLLGSVVGPVEVGLNVFATGTTTFTVAQAQALATKASGRVRAAL